MGEYSKEWIKIYLHTLYREVKIQTCKLKRCILIEECIMGKAKALKLLHADQTAPLTFNTYVCKESRTSVVWVAVALSPRLSLNEDFMLTTACTMYICQPVVIYNCMVASVNSSCFWLVLWNQFKGTVILQQGNLMIKGSCNVKINSTKE